MDKPPSYRKVQEICLSEARPCRKVRATIHGSLPRKERVLSVCRFGICTAAVAAVPKLDDLLRLVAKEQKCMHVHGHAVYTRQIHLVDFVHYSSEETAGFKERAHDRCPRGDLQEAINSHAQYLQVPQYSFPSLELCCMMCNR